MVCNLTQHDDKFFDEINVVSFKSDEVKEILGKFWVDAVPDFVLLAKNLADIAVDSGASKAVIDVPPYAVSVLEFELYTKGVTPVHYYGETYVELDVDRIIDNICEIVEKSTSKKGEVITPNKPPVHFIEESPIKPADKQNPIQDLKPDFLSEKTLQRQERSREFSKEFFKIQIKKDFRTN